MMSPARIVFPGGQRWSHAIFSPEKWAVFHRIGIQFGDLLVAQGPVEIVGERRNSASAFDSTPRCRNIRSLSPREQRAVGKTGRNPNPLGEVAVRRCWHVSQ